MNVWALEAAGTASIVTTRIVVRYAMRPVPVIVALLVCASDAHAQPRWTADVSMAALREAWDINESTDSLVGLGLGIDRRVWRGASLRGELLGLRVMQQPESAWLRGFTVGVRTRWRRAALRPLIDVAVGLSDSTRPVPFRGTRTNYLALIGAGVEMSVRSAMIAVTGRWLHASNNGRDGRHLNPDIQSLGVTVGVGWEY